MKTSSSKVTRFALAVAGMAVLFSACSDGELWHGGAGPLPGITPAPQIAEFYAEPKEVKAGGTATIFWKVIEADEISITAASSSGEPVAFSIQVEELEGSAPTPALASTTDFTLTATKKLALPEEGEGEAEAKAAELEPGAEDAGATTVSQTITVKVAVPVELRAAIKADKEIVLPGERTVVRWEVSPSEGVKIELKASTGEAIVPTDQCDGDVEAILDQEEMAEMPAVGCAVVAPEKETTYAVTATDTADAANVKEAAVTIKVEASELIVEGFTVNKQENAEVANFSDPVTLEWKVVPKGALVTITAEPKASCELPKEKAATGELESLSCKIAADTIFTLLAKMGEMESAPRVAKVKQRSGGADIKVTATAWAFPGEEIEIKIEPSGGSGAAITKISVDDASQKAGRVEVAGFGDKAAIVQKVRAPKGGVSVRWQCAGCEKEREIMAVPAVALSQDPLDDGGQPLRVTRIAPGKSEGVFYYGTQLGEFGDGAAKIFERGSKNGVMNVQFGKPLFGIPQIGTFGPPDLKRAPTFTVDSIAEAADGQALFAGVTGTIMSSDDSGATWKMFELLAYYAGDGLAYSGSHPTCAGETQKGVPAQADGSTKVVSFGNVCDMTVLGGSILMVATDRGVFALENIAEQLKKEDWKGRQWIGHPPAGKGFADGPQYLTYSRVMNDLEVVEGKVFAAASAGSGTAKGGVFVTADQGKTWTEFKSDGLKDEDVFSLFYDQKNKKLYAGTKGGVKVSGVDGASWADVGGLAKPAYAVAADILSNGSVLLAGTAEGLQVMRTADGKSAWKAVEAVGKPGKVRTLLLGAKEAEGKVSYTLRVGTQNGVTAGEVQTKPTSPSQQPPDTTPPPEEEPKPPSGTPAPVVPPLASSVREFILSAAMGKK